MSAPADRRPVDPYACTPAGPSLTQAERTARRAAFRDAMFRPCDGPRPPEPQPQVRVRPAFN